MEHRRLAGRKRRHQSVRLFGGWNAGVEGVRVACTLLGPEGSEPWPGTVGGRVPRTLAESLELCSVVRGSTDRMLRTTQWTRASFSSRTTPSGVVFDEEITMFVSVPSSGGMLTTIGQARRNELPSGGECGGRDSYSCMWSSLKEQTVDALATGAEEGRSNLR